jgi:Mg/Co/Ni transporter MgtE
MDRHIADQPIRAIMTPALVSVRPETTIGELKSLFERYDFKPFPWWTTGVSSVV